ncbi:MAG TPA: AAA family ATPase [Acidimicrobiales bacterium]|nr:AAA family ATPase [Acidimicrobiales bacterium]
MEERESSDVPRSDPTSTLEPGIGFFTVVFTDIVRSTDHRAQLGDSQADVHHADVEALTRHVMEDGRGVVVKSLGDGLMTVFRVPSDAVRASVEVQRQLARRNRLSPVAVHLRVGISVGEIDVADGDVHGYAVNEAARLCAAADPSGVLVSELAASLARRSDVDFGEVREVLVTASAPLTRALPIAIPREQLALVPLADALDVSARDDHFVGRTLELGQLLARWARAAAGNTQVAVVTGEAGLGKTTLLGRLAQQVSCGSGIVLYGRCDERVAAPYQPFVEALTHFAEHCPEDELNELLTSTGEELARLVPALARRLGTSGATALLDPEHERWRLHEAVSATLRSLCDHEPVLLVVDDVHWAGTSTVELLERVVRDHASQRLMVVLAMRPWDPAMQPEVTQLLADRHRMIADVLDVDLQGLDRDDVDELVARFHGAMLDEATTDELWAITDGNPLFLTQVLNSAGDDELVLARLPRGVTEVIDRQLNRLTLATKSLLRVASLVGISFEVRVLVMAAGLSRSEVLDGLDEATLAGVVRPLEGALSRYEFTHALVRATLENQVSEARRRDTHARVADAIEQSTGLDERERSRRLAFHWSEAGEFGDPAKGVAAVCEAATFALEHLALSDASMLIQRGEALARYVPDAHRDAQLAVLRAEVRCLAAAPEAREEQLAAVRAAKAVGDAKLLSRAALAHTRGYFTVWGRRDLERTDALETALAFCASDDRSMRARLMSRLANELTFGDVGTRRFELADQALELARELGESAVLASVINHRHYVFAAPQYLELRLREGREMQEIGRANGDRLLEMHACRLMCAAYTESADVEQLDHCLARLVQLNQDVDLAGSKWELASVRASRALLAGELKEASALVREAFMLGSAAGQADAFIFTGSQLMHLNYLRGRLPDIIDMFLEATPPEVKEHLGAWVTRQLFLAGRLDQAREWWQATIETGIESQLEVGVNAGLVLVSWAHLASVLETDESIIADLRQRLLPVADQLFQQLAPEQPGHHFLALLADATGEFELCDGHFASAILMLERSRASVMIAISEVAWARSLERRGDTSRARGLAHDAHARAVRAGALQIERDAFEILEHEG